MGWDTSPPHRNALTREVPFPQLPSAWSATSPHAQNGALSSGRLGEAHAKWAVSAGCKYNQVNSHFHCIREGCQFSFLLKHQMTSHARKHMRRMLGKNFDRVPPSQVRAALRQAIPSPARVAEGHRPSHASRWWAVPPTQSDRLPPVGSAAPGPASSVTPASFQGPPSLLDTETDEYLDYTGCSPGAMSSESSTMDRSCSSTPVGNESTAAGEPAAGASGRRVSGRPGRGRGGLRPSRLGQAPPPKAQHCWVPLRTGGSWSNVLKGRQAHVQQTQLVGDMGH